DAYFEADKREIIRHKEYAEQLITALPEGLAVVDETMAIRSHNPAMYRLLCIAEAEPVASPFFSVETGEPAQPGDDHSLAGQCLATLVPDADLTEMVAEVIHAGGSGKNKLVRFTTQHKIRHLDIQVSPVLV